MPATIAPKTLSPSLNSKLREKSPEPSPRAATPITTMMISPITSIEVRITLTCTDSAMPRALMAATSRMKISAASTSGKSTNSPR